MNNKSRAPGRRSQAESARTRARLLDRAERLFARKGYRGVTLRELAQSCGVRPYTIQHHFGSKLGLYRAVLSRWDRDVLECVSQALAQPRDFPTLVKNVVNDLFEMLLARRNWVAVTARASLGEGLSPGAALEDRTWVRFMESALRAQRRSPGRVELGLLLITVEGILNHHVLSAAHYRRLFGRDVTDPRIKARTKRHLERAILALVDPGERRQPEAHRRTRSARSACAG